MGYDGCWTGQITITPPILVTQPDGFYRTQFRDIRLRISSQPVHSVAAAYQDVIKTVEPAMQTFSGYDVEDELRALIERWPGHEFAGCFDVSGPEGDRWRLTVVDRAVVRQVARAVWPGDPTVDVPVWRGNRGSFQFHGQQVTVDAGTDGVVLLVQGRQLPMSFEQAELLGLELLSAARAKGLVA